MTALATAPTAPLPTSPHPTDPEATTPPRAALFAPLRFLAYRFLWAGRLVSLVGDAFQLVVLPVLVLDLTQRPSGLGAVLMAQAIPRTLLLLAGGLLADRFRPRAVMVASSLVQALVVAALLLPIVTGTLELWHVYVYAVAFGAVSAFFLPASTSIVPELVPPDQVRAGNALALVTGNLTRFLIPPLAGLVIATAGRPVAFAVNAASFCLAALLFHRIAAPRCKPAAPTAPTAGVLAELRAGLSAARQDPQVWLAIQLSTVFWFGYAGAILVGLPALAKLTYELGDQGLGLLFGASGAGALLGALVAGGARVIRRPAATATGAITLGGVMLALAGLAPSVWLTLPCLVVSSALGSACAVIFLSLVQSRTGASTRGRVMSLMTLGVFGFAPFSYAAAGAAADALGPRGLFVGAGLLLATFGAATQCHPAVRSGGRDTPS